jgi:hypothetical protein
MPVERFIARWVERGSWFIAGLLWLIWLGYEDRSIRSVLTVAAAISAAIGVTTYRTCIPRIPSTPRARLGLKVISAGFAGGLVGVLAVVLMLVKLSLHNHGAPEFNVGDVLLSLRTVPAWLAAGLISGLAVGLSGLALERRAP